MDISCNWHRSICRACCGCMVSYTSNSGLGDEDAHKFHAVFPNRLPFANKALEMSRCSMKDMKLRGIVGCLALCARDKTKARDVTRKLLCS